jgi:hypothetical protein
MLKRLAASTIAVAAILSAPAAVRAQTASPPSARALDGWGRPVAEPDAKATPAPAPIHDISGIWTPANGPGDGIGGIGARDMPADGKPEHQLPYTPLALEKMQTYKPGNGSKEVDPSKDNDPAVIYCDPQGMPRQDLYELRTTQILQTPLSVYVLYEFSKLWRVIWADGRDMPKNAEPRWFGYSTGKWVNDTTFVVETTGTDERTWLDKAGRPHSDDLRVEETFHRVNHDRLELSVLIDDPKMYTKTWLALDKFPFNLLPPSYDVREMMCSVSEFIEYNKAMGFGNPTLGNDKK